MSEVSEPGKIPAPAERKGRLANLRYGGGRPPGVPNKTTVQAREAIRQLIEANVPKMAGWLEAIEAKEGPLVAWRCLETMVEFAVPKLVRSEVDATIRRPEDDLDDAELVALIERLRASKPKAPA